MTYFFRLLAVLGGLFGLFLIVVEQETGWRAAGVLLCALAVYFLLHDVRLAAEGERLAAEMGRGTAEMDRLTAELQDTKDEIERLTTSSR